MLSWRFAASLNLCRAVTRGVMRLLLLLGKKFERMLQRRRPFCGGRAPENFEDGHGPSDGRIRHTAMCGPMEPDAELSCGTVEILLLTPQSLIVHDVAEMLSENLMCDAEGKRTGPLVWSGNCNSGQLVMSKITTKELVKDRRTKPRRRVAVCRPVRHSKMWFG